MTKNQRAAKHVSDPRRWIVTLFARSAARLAGDHLINILATPESTANVAAVQIRNARAIVNDKTFVRALAVEAGGQATSAEHAVATLGNIAPTYFQVISLAANGAIDEPEHIVAFAPPTEDKRESSPHNSMSMPTRTRPLLRCARRE